MSRTCFISLALSILAAGQAHAQAQAPASPFRGYISVNGGLQLASGDFATGASTRVHAEDGRLDTTYTLRRGPTFDVAGGGILWRRLGAGVGVSRFSVATPGALTARVPHPFFFNQPRNIGAEVAGLAREELAIHVQARGIVPAGDRLQVMVFGGPSFFQVKQGLVADYSYTDGYPYDEASFRSATTTTVSVSKMGFNAGADVAFFLTRQLGVGGMIRYAGTTIPLGDGEGAPEVTAGGVHVGGGLRLRF